MSRPAPTVLVLPGYQSSGPAHWQSLWQQRHPDYRRVEQADWENPVCADWVEALDAAVRGAGGPVVLAAHSLGCIAALHWASGHRDSVVADSVVGGSVVGALLVAPADVEWLEAPPSVKSFRPIPLAPLPFPTIVVASDDDLFADVDRVRQWAAAWGSRLVCLERAGHINADAGFGPWPEGEALLAQLMA